MEGGAKIVELVPHAAVASCCGHFSNILGGVHPSAISLLKELIPVMLASFWAEDGPRV
jgi:hypothetical protein